jgi:hypothetical protein
MMNRVETGSQAMRIRTISALVLTLLGATLPVTAQAQVWRADQGDGTYRNPILFADYPDPDIIRVGQDFYFASTTFANVPGITLLHSRDLVNWRIAGHVLDRLGGSPTFDLKDGGAIAMVSMPPACAFMTGCSMSPSRRLG